MTRPFATTYARRFKPLKAGSMHPATVMLDGRIVPAWQAAQERKEQTR